MGEQSDEEATNAFQDAFGIAVWDGFGQTENTILVANTRGATVSPGSIGLPTPGHEIAVIDADGTALPAGVEGDLALHGRPPSLFAGYWNAPETTAAAFRGAWFLTGERALCDEEGHIWLAGRAARSQHATPEDELLEEFAAATNGAHPDPAADAVALEIPVAADRETPVDEAAALVAIEAARAAAAERKAQEEARRHDELAAAAAAAEQAAAAARAEAERARREAEAREAEAREAAEREEARRREEEAAAAALAAAEQPPASNRNNAKPPSAKKPGAAKKKQPPRPQRQPQPRPPASNRNNAKPPSAKRPSRREEEAAAAALAAAAAEAARLEQEQREAAEREEAKPPRRRSSRRGR